MHKQHEPRVSKHNADMLEQVLQESATERLLATRRADQQRAMSHMREDAGLRELQVIEGPLIDLEVSLPPGRDSHLAC